MPSQQQRYIAYLVRLWQTGLADTPIWRASLEDPHTGERRSFANLDVLFAFLEARTYGSSRPYLGDHPVIEEEQVDGWIQLDQRLQKTDPEP
jgi:hypothetical protein